MKKLLVIFVFIAHLYSVSAEYKWVQETLLTSYGLDKITKDTKGNYYYSTKIGPFISLDGMNTWIERVSHKVVLGFTLDNKDNIYICSDSLYLSQDMSRSYSSHSFSFDSSNLSYMRASQLLFQNDTFAVVVRQISDSVYSDIYISVDSCKNFTRTIRLSDTLEGINGGKNNISGFIFDKNHNYYFYNLDSGIYKIQNIAKPKASIVYPVPFATTWTAFKMISDSILVILWDGLLKYSIDEGNTWKDFENQPAYFYTIGTNQNTLLAVDLDRCWKTTDLGKTWEVICSGLLYTSYIATPIIADNGTVFICRPYINESVLKGTLITDIEEKTNRKDDIYYNELTNLITIKTNEIIEQVNIYDLMGNLINNIQTFGNVIDATLLSSGSYFYKIKTSTKTLTGVVIIYK